MTEAGALCWPGPGAELDAAGATDCAPWLRAIGLPLPRHAFLHYDTGELWSRIPGDVAAALDQLCQEALQTWEAPAEGVPHPSAPELWAFVGSAAVLELAGSWSGRELRPLPDRFRLTLDRPGCSVWPRPRWPRPDPDRPVVLHLFLSTHENGEGGALELRVAAAHANSLVVRPHRGHAVLFTGAMPHRVHPVATGLDGKARPRLCLEAAFAPVDPLSPEKPPVFPVKLVEG